MIQMQKTVKIIPFGGLGEVGRNMMVFEYENEIMIVDLGLRFPEEDMPGIDFLIPNIEYLKGKEKNIKAIIFTHGHYDHIGAVPYLIDKLGEPTIYAARLTQGIITRRQEDFPRAPRLKMITVEDGSQVKIGNYFEVEFFHVNHNIPDDLALIIRTPAGIIFHTSDFKLDPTPINDKPLDIQKLKTLAKEGVTLLLADSTGAENEGHSISEITIQTNLEEIFKKSKGRIIAGTFSSLINRIQQLISLSEKYGRKVIVEGYSMKMNVEISKQLGYIKSQKHTFIGAQEVDKYPPSKITVICTGAQGEGNASLMKIANREHAYIEIQKGDTVIFSSSVIPGNERTVQILKDQLYREGAKVVHYKMMDIHAGGHAQREDLKELIEALRPQFFMPIHGNYSMLVLNAELAQSLNIPEKNTVVAENGAVIYLTKEQIKVAKETVPANYIMVDGLGVGDIGEVVLRDRQVMSKDGMFVIITVIDSQTGKVKGSPDIISRGFIYMKESRELLNQTRKKVREIVARTTSQEKGFNWAYVRDNLRDKIGQFLYSKTQRRPMILPVIIEI